MEVLEQYVEFTHS